MGLKYAELCTQCGKRRTRHPAGFAAAARLIHWRQNASIAVDERPEAVIAATSAASC